MDRAASRHLRWAVLAVVAAVVVGGVQLSAWASTSSPSLPVISARDLLIKAQQAQVSQLSGTVRSTTALGLPALPSQAGADWTSLAAGTQTLRVFADGPQRQRVDLLGDLTQASVVHDRATVWTWSSTTRKVTRLTLPDTVPQPVRPLTAPGLPGPGPTDLPLTPQQAADRALAAITPSTTVTVGRNSSVAGRDAYDLRLSPQDPASLIGQVDLYVDARTGLALRTVVVPRGSREPAIDIGFTSLRLAAPPAKTFQFSPPPGASVQNLTLPAAQHGDRPRGPVHQVEQPAGHVLGSGWTSVIEGESATNAPRLVPGEASKPLSALLRSAQPVQGSFGSGRLLRTRLLTVLLTDDGRIFAGAVSRAELLRVASSAVATPVR